MKKKKIQKINKYQIKTKQKKKETLNKLTICIK